MGSPKLLADRFAPVSLAMAILSGDLAYQILHSVAPPGRSDNQRIAVHPQVDMIAITETDLLRDRFGNPQCQAISPFLDSCSHRNLQRRYVFVGSSIDSIELPDLSSGGTPPFCYGSMSGKFVFNLKSGDKRRQFPYKILLGQQQNETSKHILLKVLG